MEKANVGFIIFLCSILLVLSIATASDLWVSPEMNHSEETDMQVLCDKIREHGWKIYYAYQEELSNEDKFIWIILQTHIDILTPQSAGNQLLEDLLSCSSPEAFSEILHNKYLHITEAPEGQPCQAAVLQEVQRTKQYAGYSSLPHSTAIKVPYSGLRSDIWYGFAGEWQDERTHFLTIKFDPDLFTNEISYRPIYQSVQETPLVEETKQAVLKRVTTFIQACVSPDVLNKLDVGNIECSERLGTDQTYAYVYVFIPYFDSNQANIDANQMADNTLWAFFRIDAETQCIYEYSPRITDAVRRNYLYGNEN